MPESDLLLYAAYAAKRMLPARRMELYLAQLTALVHNAAFSGQKSLSDFLFEPMGSDQDAPASGLEETPETLAQREADLDRLFGFAGGAA